MVAPPGRSLPARRSRLAAAAPSQESGAVVPMVSEAGVHERPGANVWYSTLLFMRLSIVVHCTINESDEQPAAQAVHALPSVPGPNNLKE